jgi:hypothetical protein
MDPTPIPFDYKPRPYQLPILRAIDDGINRVVWVAHRRSGKDKTCLNIIVKKMLQRVGAYFYVLPTFAQAKKIIWDGIDGDGKKFMRHFPAELIDGRPNETEMKLTLKNGSLFQLIGSDKIDSIIGTNPVGIVFSEYAIQDPKAWGYLRPILAENKGWAIFNGTPRGQNHFKQLYSSALHEPGWFAQINRASETGAISKDILEQEKREIIEQFGSDALFQQEYECSFDVQMSIHQFISSEIVNAARGKALAQSQYFYAPVILSVDPSWTGKDELVIAKRQGLAFTILKTIPKNDDDSKIASLLTQLEDEHDADAVFIDLGYGQGIYSFGKSLQRNWQLVAFGSASNNPQYLNKRAEMWGEMKKWLQEGGSIPNDPVLCDELMTPEAYVIQTGINAGKIQIESKKHMNDRQASSPNRADALALTFAFPVKKKSNLTVSARSSISDYDPLGEFNQPARKEAYDLLKL